MIWYFLIGWLLVALITGAVQDASSAQDQVRRNLAGVTDYRMREILE